ncbi:MAG TPA: hemerythrin domain-containing protein [Candidatus Polarisedimenticolia bacterium]|nr:hemerythrin domain-containing protein [Candidatus Polarisedimenticolia bacterium]
MTNEPKSLSVFEYLEADHRRLDGLMEEFGRALEDGDTARAGDRFAVFRRGLMRHIKMEEGLLFPAFEMATGLRRENGPTGVMRHEHAGIILAMGAIADTLAGEPPDLAKVRRARAALCDLLAPHGLKEERVIYPMVDGALASDRLAGLVATMQRFP